MFLPTRSGTEVLIPFHFCQSDRLKSAVSFQFSACEHECVSVYLLLLVGMGRVTSLTEPGHLAQLFPELSGLSICSLAPLSPGQ